MGGEARETCPQLRAWVCSGHAAVSVSGTAKPSSASISIDLKYAPTSEAMEKRGERETKTSKKIFGVFEVLV